TTEAERWRRRGDQLDASDVFVHSNFVTAQASRGDRGMNGLAFRLVLMALETLRRVDVLVEGNRMLLGEGGHRPDHKENRQQLKETGEGLTDAGFPVHLKTA